MNISEAIQLIEEASHTALDLNERRAGESKSKKKVSRDAVKVLGILARLKSRMRVVAKGALKRNQFATQLNRSKSADDLAIPKAVQDAARELAGITRENFAKAASGFNKSVRKLPLDPREESMLAMSAVQSLVNNKDFERGVPTLAFFRDYRYGVDALDTAIKAIKGEKFVSSVNDSRPGSKY